MIKNKQLFALQVFNALRFGIAVLIAIIFAKVADSESITIYESLVLIGTTFTFFYASAINHTLVPFVESSNDQNRSTAYASAFSLLIVGVILSTMAMIVYAFAISGPEEKSYLIWYTLFILFNIPSLLAENILLVEKRNKSLMFYGVISFGLQLLAIGIPLFNGNLYLGIKLLGLFSFLKLIYTVILIRKFGDLTTNLTQVKSLFKVSSPVMGSLFLANGYLYASTFLIKFNTNPESFNLFRYGSREFPLFMIMANSFSTIQSGLIAKSGNRINEALKEMKQASKRLIHQLFPAAIVLSLTSFYIFRFVFNAELAEAYEIFNILLLILLSRMLFPQSILLAIRKNKSMIYASFIEFVVGIALSLWWINSLGIMGVAWAMVAAHIADKLVLIYFAKKEGFPLSSYFPWKIYLLYAIPLVILVLNQ